MGTVTCLGMGVARTDIEIRRRDRYCRLYCCHCEDRTRTVREEAALFGCGVVRRGSATSTRWRIWGYPWEESDGEGELWDPG